MVAMSSTSIVVKVLTDYRAQNTQQGQITIGTLIMQARVTGRRAPVAVPCDQQQWCAAAHTGRAAGGGAVNHKGVSPRPTHWEAWVAGVPYLTPVRLPHRLLAPCGPAFWFATAGIITLPCQPTALAGLLGWPPLCLHAGAGHCRRRLRL